MIATRSRQGVPGEQPAVCNMSHFMADYYLKLPAIRAEDQSRVPTDAQIEREYRDFRRLWSRNAYSRVNDLSTPTRTFKDWHLPLLRILGFNNAPQRCEFDIEHQRTSSYAYVENERKAMLIDPLPFAKSADDRLDSGARRGDTAQRHMEQALESTSAPFGLILGGTSWRILKLDTNSDRYIEFDLAAIQERDDLDAFGLLTTFISPTALLGEHPLLPDLVERSQERGTKVGEQLGPATRRALQVFLEAVRTNEANRAWAPELFVEGDALQRIHREGISLLYRLLFVLYAEAKDALPLSMPLYREYYSLERIRNSLANGVEFTEHSSALWESVKALFRLIDSGARTNDLVIPAYNGGLFARTSMLNLDRAQVSDKAFAEVLRELTIITVETGKKKNKQADRVSFHELGVDQLGAVFESLLDYEPHIARNDLYEISIGNGKNKGTSFLPDLTLGTAKSAPDVPIIANGQFYLQAWGGQRKSTGAYYTPRPIADYLVREALGPQVKGKSSKDILKIAVCDPAMGSGGFLVSATEFLGKAYYLARSNEDWDPEDENAEDHRMEARRIVAERCIYGVDMNPMAVELAKVSLWMTTLTTMSAQRPLSFFNHHLRCGNSLLCAPLRNDDGTTTGTRIQTILDPAYACVDKEASNKEKEQLKATRKRNAAELATNKKGGGAPMFALDLREPLYAYAHARAQLSSADDPTQSATNAVTLARDKERQLRELTEDPRSQFFKLKEICNLWMAPWFWPHEASGDPPTTDEYQKIAREIWEYRGPQTEKGQRILDESRRIAQRHRFFHWELEFPEVFEHGGFNAIIGNPPWETIAPKTQEFFSNYDVGFREYGKQRAVARMKEICKNHDIDRAYHQYARERYQQSAYIRESGSYPWLSKDGGNVDIFRAFVEHSYGAVCKFGSLAQVLPSSFYQNANCSHLRQHLSSDDGRIRSLIVNQNERFIFPIHHAMKVLTLIADKSIKNPSIPVAFFTGKDALNRMRALSSKELSDVLATPERHLIHCPIALLRNLSPDTYSFIEISDQLDVTLLEHLSKHGVPFGKAWEPQYCRELDMTNDSHLFVDRDQLKAMGARFDGMCWHHPKHGEFWPLAEGKHIYQYEFPVGEFNYWVNSKSTSKLPIIKGKPVNAYSRLAWRDVASSTNERTLIATIVFPKNFMGHTLLSIAGGTLRKENIEQIETILNSFIFDWQARIRGGTHMSQALLNQLFVPSSIKNSVFSANHRIQKEALVMQAFDLPFELAEHLMAGFPLLDRLQPKLPDEPRSTITRDLVLARYAESLKQSRSGFYRERANRAIAIGAKPFIPATRSEPDSDKIEEGA